MTHSFVLPRRSYSIPGQAGRKEKQQFVPSRAQIDTAKCRLVGAIRKHGRKLTVTSYKAVPQIFGKKICNRQGQLGKNRYQLRMTLTLALGELCDEGQVYLDRDSWQMVVATPLPVRRERRQKYPRPYRGTGHRAA